MLKFTSRICRWSIRPITLFSARNKSESPQITSSSTNFTPIYEFPYIRVVSLVNRLKLYQTTLTMLAIPTSLILTELKIISQESAFITVIVGATGCATLFSLGYFADKFVGFIYLDKQENCIRVAYADFWGRRKDMEVPLADIVPLSEVPSSIMDMLYLRLSRFSEKDIFKISVKYGVVLDKEKLRKVFAAW